MVNDLLLSRTTKRPSFTVARGVWNEAGQLLGIIIAGILPEKLDRTFALHRPREAAVSLIDSKGMLVYGHPTTEYTWEQRNWLRLYPAIGEALKGSDVVATVTSDLTGTDRLVGFTPIASIGWVSAADRAIDEAMEPVTSSLIWQAGGFLFTSLASFLLALWISRTIAAPIEKIHGHALALGRGYWDNRVEVSGPKEAQALAEALNWMSAERKQAEEALRESEELYRGVVQNTTAVILRVDPKGIILFANQRALEFFGYSIDELIGRRALGTIVPERETTGRDLVAMIDELVAAPDRFRSNANENMKKNGERVWLEWTNSGIYDASGNLKEFLSVGIDATERKRAEEQLEETRSRLSVIVDSIADGFYALDGEFRFTHINNAALSYFGKNRGEMIGKSLFEVFPEVPGSVFESNYRRAMVSGRPEHFETLSVVATGRAVEMHAYPGPGNLTVLFRDVTERKRMELALEAAINEAINEKNRLEAVMEALPVGVAIVDTLGGNVKANPAYERVWTGPRPTVRSVSDYAAYKAWRVDSGELLRPEEWASALAVLRGKTVIGQVLEIERFDGSHTFIHNSAAPVLDAQGHIVGSAVAVMDITDRVEAEEALKRARDELELRVQERTAELARANEELRSFPSLLIEVQEEERKRLAVELHDSIGQTLAALKFNIEHILGLRESGKDHEAVDRLKQFILILQRSIDETRSIYMGLRPTILTELGIIATLQWFVREFMRLYPKHHVELEIGVEETEIPEPLKLSIFRISQEALNNISKHSKAEWVDLSLQRSGSGIELTIADDGVGMDLEYIRSHASTARSLGLTIMRERAEFTRGSLSIESTPGEGTTVRGVWQLHKSQACLHP